MIIIPAIDIIEGKCVRLSQGDYNQKKIYNADPLDMAKKFEQHGITRLHLVDLEGAKAKKVVNWKVLEKLVKGTSLKIDFGGGIKSDEDIKLVFDCGAYQATIGSVAVQKKELFRSWLGEFSAERIILGADVKDKSIAVSGWLEDSGIDIFPFLEENLAFGIQYVLCTDISKDGMLEGTSIELYQELIDHFSGMKLIASGGITTVEEIEKLAEMEIYGAIIGKALYEGHIRLKELEKFILQNN